ncbi:MAG: GTP 3',8-cyclase MoaA [Thermoplasmata archaeon]
MIDNYGRKLQGVRLSITSRCNLSCFYCHGEGQAEEKDELSLREIAILSDYLSKMGVDNVKLTGGEPLLRDDVTEIARFFRKKSIVPGITTNGTLLLEKARELRNAGVSHVNVNLPSTNEKIYEKITGKNFCRKVIEGCVAARNEGIAVKLNVVVLKGLNDTVEHFQQMLGFGENNRIHLQLIELESPVPMNPVYRQYHTTLDHLEKYVSNLAIDITKKEKLHNTTIYTLANGTKVEIVSPMGNHDFCMHCTRLRITASGKIKPCLFAEPTVDIRPALDDFEKFKEAVRCVWFARKPYF